MQLFTENINPNQPSKKRDFKIIGLFEDIGKKGILIELQLP